MKTMKKTAIVVMSAMALAACSPGMYTGGGWAHTAGAGDSNASFSFSVESCDTETLGHFSLNDEGWKVPVEMSGHVMDFGELGEFGRGAMVKEFDEVVFTAPVGEVQGPVKTDFGFHLLEVTKRTD